MSDFLERCRGLWDKIRMSPAESRVRFRIPNERIDIGRQLHKPFESDTHYFQVRINEMWLNKERQWFSHVDPMVTVVSEFIYDKKHQAVPFVVGPALMKKHGFVSSAGVEYTDTRVAGLHPYRGGRIALSIILFQVTRSNHARDLMRLIEQGVGALDFSSAINTYLKIADVVLEGLESVLRLDGLQPCLGLRTEIEPDPAGKIYPGYYVLIDIPADDPRVGKLWVRNNRLVIGETIEKAKPFRDSDFVLYSIAKEDVRSVRTLSFYPLWERVQREAQQARPDAWISAKANLLSLCQEMRLSPDITETHCSELINEYKTKAKQRYEEAIALVSLSQKNADGFEKIRSEALDILDL